MQAARQLSEKEAFTSKRRADKEITDGLGVEIERLHELSVLKRSREILFFVTLYAIGAASIVYFSHIPAFILLGILCMGTAFNSLGILIHEGLHGLLAKNAKVNHLISFLIGVPIGMSATAYGITHNNHHYYLGRKLDYGTYRQHLKYKPLVWFAYFLQLFLGTVIYVAVIPFVAFITASRKARIFILVEYGCIIALFIFLFRHMAINDLLLFWGYPLVFMSILTNIRGLASHAVGDTENIYLSSRTIPSSKLVSTLFLHENFHLEHHLFPGVPSYHLEQMHALIWKRLPEALYSRSYTHFLLSFLIAASKNDLQPMGVVHPIGD